MYWYLFFVLLILVITLPFKFRTWFKFNILNMSGEVFATIMGIKIIKIKVKVKNNFIYITKKGITYKEKLAPSNIDVIYVLNLINALYFRTRLYTFAETSEIGYKNNALTSALMTASVDILFKSAFGIIKNHKKSSHIFLLNSPKYNDDCLILNLEAIFSLNFLDLIYCLITTKIKSKGEKFERKQEDEPI